MIRAAMTILVGVLAVGCAGAGANRSRPNDPLVQVTAQHLYRQGQHYQAAHDFIRAEQYFSAAAARGYPEEIVLPALLKSCIASGRYQSALQHGADYLTRHPGDWRVRFVVASIYLALEQPGRARAELERVIAAKPRLAAPHYTLASVLSRDLGQTDEAADHYRTYLELAPDGRRAFEARDWLRDRAKERRKQRRRRSR